MLKYPQTREDKVKFLKETHGGYIGSMAEAIVDRTGNTPSFDEYYNDLNRSLQKGWKEQGLGRSLGQIANLTNPNAIDKKTKEQMNAEIAGMKGDVLESAKGISDFAGKLKNWIDPEELKNVNSMFQQAAKYYPEANQYVMKDAGIGKFDALGNLFGETKTVQAPPQGQIAGVGKTQMGKLAAENQPTPERQLMGGAAPIQGAPAAKAPQGGAVAGAIAGATGAVTLPGGQLTSQQIFEQIKAGQLTPSQNNSQWRSMYQNGMATQAQKEAYQMWVEFNSKGGQAQPSAGQDVGAGPTQSQKDKINADRVAKGLPPLYGVQEEINQVNDDANKEQEAEVAKIQEETDKVDLSSSADLINKLIESLEEDKAEPTVSLEQKFADERAKLGVSGLEGDLANTDAQIAKLDADFKSLMPEEEARRVSMSQINRRQTAEELQYNRKRNDLIATRNSIANELNSKYTVIDSMMKFAGQDIDNAQQNYNEQFDRNIKLINLVKGIEDEAKSDAERKIDNARANLTIMTNLLKEGNLDYDSLDPVKLSEIRNLEITAGLPIGFTSFVHENIKDPVTHWGSSFTDESGSIIQPVYTVDANGNISQQNIKVGTKSLSVSEQKDLLEGGYETEGGKVVKSKGIPKEEIIGMKLQGKGVSGQSSFMQDLAKADAEMKADGLGGLDINQSYRTYEQQVEIRKDLGYTSDDQPSGYNGLPLAAPPGQSFHNLGLAVDITNYPAAAPYLKKYGIVNGLQGDMGHFSRGELNPDYYSKGESGSDIKLSQAQRLKALSLFGKDVENASELTTDELKQLIDNKSKPVNPYAPKT